MFPIQAQSLYFSEKQGKKSIVMKGGQVVVRRKKAQRKDKGVRKQRLFFLTYINEVVHTAAIMLQIKCLLLVLHLTELTFVVLHE